jgi:hypothetical protein
MQGVYFRSVVGSHSVSFVFSFIHYVKFVIDIAGREFDLRPHRN